jgi:hypothetical protein
MAQCPHSEQRRRAGAHLRRINANISAQRGANPPESHQSMTAPTRGTSEAREAEWNIGISDPDERLHYT